MKISVLGAGRWASCIALCMSRKNYKVLMWARPREDGTESELFLTHKNQYVELNNNVSFTHDLKKAVGHGEVIVISILSQQLDDLMQKVKTIPNYENKKYCLAMKGIEASSCRRLSEILLDNGVKKENIAVLVGPGHVQAISRGEPTNMIISAYSEDYARFLVSKFSHSGVLDLTHSNDIIGTEIGAAAKNVIGIASGVLEGGGFSQMKGPLMVASTREISKFIDALGGDKMSAYSLSFLGDFHATLYDHNSKNLSYGKAIVEKKSLDGKVLGLDTRSVEGIKTSGALIKMKERYNSRVSNASQIKMPITTAVNDLVNGKIPLDKASKYMCENITESLEL